MKILGQSVLFFNNNKQINNNHSSHAAANPFKMHILAKDTVSFSGAEKVAQTATKAAVNLSRKTIMDLPKDLSGKRLFVKVDHNLPKGDDSRMTLTIPTILNLLERKANLVIGTHVGDPFKVKDGELGKKVSTAENAVKLQNYIREHKGFEHIEVIHASAVSPEAVVDEKIIAKSKELKPNQILYLENLRFTPAETGKGAKLNEQTGEHETVKISKEAIESHSQQLAQLADMYVNDAFGAAHRAHASVTGITKHIQGPKVAGLLMDKEIKNLSSAIQNPERPFVAIIGGSKVGPKIGILSALLEKVNTLIVGGGMANTFELAKGGKVGKSLVEADKVEQAQEIMTKAKEKGVKLILPSDAVIAKEISNEAQTQTVPSDKIPDEMKALDIGPKSVQEIKEGLQGAKTILWNGPVGVFETPKFAGGTNKIAEAVAEVTEKNQAKSIIGGGDTGSAIKQSGIPAEKFTHISTGGGASLEMMEKEGNLPGITSLDEK